MMRIASRAVLMLYKKDVTKAAGSLQLSAGQDACAEAVVHAIRYIFADVDTDEVLLIHAENAYSTL